MMKNIYLIFLVISSSLFLEAQPDPLKFSTRVQISTGVLSTLPGKLDREYGIESRSYYGFQQSLQISFCVPIDDFNVGLGTGVSLRTGDVIYPPSLSPKVFLLFELCNAKKRSLFSFIINAGLMEGSIQKKACIYFGGGPSLNICKTFHPISISINPYIECHWGESKDISFLGASGHPNETYTFIYKTLTGNLSCIIQFNFFKKNKEK